MLAQLEELSLVRSLGEAVGPLVGETSLLAQVIVTTDTSRGITAPPYEIHQNILAFGSTLATSHSNNS
eukprot:3732379-Pleurochrysis_carterae.AAC.3